MTYDNMWNRYNDQYKNLADFIAKVDDMTIT